MSVTLVLDISRVCIEGLHFVHGSHVGPGYTSYKLSEGLADHIWVGVVTLVLDIPRRNSVTGWRSHVELDIPRRSSLKGWRIVYGICQSRWSWIYLEYVLKVCISYMAVMLALDIPRINSVKGWRIIFGLA